MIDFSQSDFAAWQAERERNRAEIDDMQETILALRMVADAAHDEIETLTRCLNIAAGYISSTPGYTHMRPDQVVAMLRNAVLTGDEEEDQDD